MENKMETIEELKKKIKEQERRIEDLEDKLFDGDGVNLVDYWYQMYIDLCEDLDDRMDYE